MSNRTFVIGVGMTKFDKPGSKEGDYPDWAKEAGEKALADAGIPYDTVEQAYAGYCYGDSTYGQRAVYQLVREQMRGHGYQSIQSMIAVSTGGFFGRGFCASKSAPCVGWTR